MATASPSSVIPHAPLPHIAIAFCTQCRWMLRAAYFAQELLSTFGTSIGEVALQPTTGGLFQVHITYVPQASQSETTPGSEATEEARSSGYRESETLVTALLWDRKAEGGFPETKVLKQRVRDCIEPGKDLGHSDKGGKVKEAVVVNAEAAPVQPQQQLHEDGIGEAPCA